VTVTSPLFSPISEHNRPWQTGSVGVDGRHFKGAALMPHGRRAGFYASGPLLLVAAWPGR